jgi:hypothetical protein
MSSDRRDEYEDDDDRPARRERPHYERDHRGGMILAFGIVGITTFTCFLGLVFGILAWVMGNNDLKAMESGEMDPEGKSLTQAGKVCGMIGAILSFLYLMAVGAYFVFIFVLIAMK